MTRHVLAALGFVFALCATGAAWADPDKPYDFEEKPWAESETVIPDFPKPENLMEFQAGPTERNRFFLDGSSIAAGSDGIVRYVLVVKTEGGGSNVSLEGVRCDTREYKLFAVGLTDGTWSKLRNPQWRLIETKLVNQYRAALNRDYLCPGGLMQHDAAAVRAALRRGNRAVAP